MWTMYHKMVLFIIILFTFIISSSCDLGDLCGNKKTGKCILATQCKAVEEALRKRKHHNLERCGFQGDIEIVCCNDHKDFGTRNQNLRKSAVACKSFQGLLDISPFILGGENASLGEFPHMASLAYEDDTSDDYNYECGGSLISDNYVLTAAHCLVRIDGKVPKMVRMGKIDLFGNADNTDPQDIPVENIYPHEMYSWQERINDIGLVKLSKPIERTVNVKPICLYLKDDDPPELTVAGFGKVGNTRDGSRFLLRTYLAPVPLQTCNSSTTRRIATKPVFETQLCATSKDDVARDTCEGDSGGPMQIEAKRVDGVNIPASLVGVTSYGPLCGGKLPSIYTRVSKYIDWIEERVWP